MNEDDFIHPYQTISGWSQIILNLSKMNYEVRHFHNSLLLKMSSKDL